MNKSFGNGRYVSASLSPEERYQEMLAARASNAEEHHPKNICTGCDHSRAAHLDQPYTKGGPPVSDRGWCARPEGSCIFKGCTCLTFGEPKE